jgi:lipopolysaccharide export LptBFGC system permease protein LptF
MKLKGTGRSLIVTGVICTLFYVLVSLYGESAAGLRIGTFLLYVGIVMIIIGIAVRLLRTSPRA